MNGVGFPRKIACFFGEAFVFFTQKKTPQKFCGVLAFANYSAASSAVSSTASSGIASASACASSRSARIERLIF